MADFQFSKCQMSAILDFQKLKILTSGSEAHCASYAKFREDTLNRSGDMAFGTLKKFELRLHAKFRRYRSKRG